MHPVCVCVCVCVTQIKEVQDWMSDRHLDKLDPALRQEINVRHAHTHTHKHTLNWRPCPWFLLASVVFVVL